MKPNWTPATLRLGEIEPWTDNPMKTCSRCLELKPIGDFHKKGHTAAGTPRRKEYCKSCASAVFKLEYPQKRDKQIANALRWNKANKEKKNTNNTKSRERHLAEARARDRKYHEENKEKRNAAARLYYSEHKLQSAIYKREWAKRNPEKVVTFSHRRRARKLAVDNSLTSTEWQDIKTSYGNKCVYCGNVATEQDHVVPLSSGGGHTAENVAPSCKHCNVTKGAKSLLGFLYYQNYKAVSSNV